MQSGDEGSFRSTANLPLELTENILKSHPNSSKWPSFDVFHRLFGRHEPNVTENNLSHSTKCSSKMCKETRGNESHLGGSDEDKLNETGQSKNLSDSGIPRSKFASRKMTNNRGPRQDLSARSRSTDQLSITSNSASKTDDRANVGAIKTLAGKVSQENNSLVSNIVCNREKVASKIPPMEDSICDIVPTSDASQNVLHQILTTNGQENIMLDNVNQADDLSSRLMTKVTPFVTPREAIGTKRIQSMNLALVTNIKNANSNDSDMLGNLGHRKSHGDIVKADHSSRRLFSDARPVNAKLESQNSTKSNSNSMLNIKSDDQTSQKDQQRQIARQKTTESSREETSGSLLSESSRRRSRCNRTPPPQKPLLRMDTPWPQSTVRLPTPGAVRPPRDGKTMNLKDSVISEDQACRMAPPKSNEEDRRTTKQFRSQESTMNTKCNKAKRIGANISKSRTESSPKTKQNTSKSATPVTTGLTTTTKGTRKSNKKRGNGRSKLSKRAKTRVGNHSEADQESRNLPATKNRFTFLENGTSTSRTPSRNLSKIGVRTVNPTDSSAGPTAQISTRRTVFDGKGAARQHASVSLQLGTTQAFATQNEMATPPIGGTGTEDGIIFNSSAIALPHQEAYLCAIDLAKSPMFRLCKMSFSKRLCFVLFLLVLLPMEPTLESSTRIVSIGTLGSFVLQIPVQKRRNPLVPLDIFSLPSRERSTQLRDSIGTDGDATKTQIAKEFLLSPFQESSNDHQEADNEDTQTSSWAKSIFDSLSAKYWARS